MTRGHGKQAGPGTNRTRRTRPSRAENAGSRRRAPRHHRETDSARRGEAQIVSRAIEDFIQRAGIAQEVSLALCQKHWAQTCGPTLAKRSRPVRLHGTVLIVAVQDSICFQELTMRRQDLLTTLTGLMDFGTKPTDIHFFLEAPEG